MTSRKKSGKRRSPSRKSRRPIGSISLKKGTLSQFGYSSFDTITNRRKALGKAVRKLGYGTVVKKVNVVAILNKNRNPTVSRKMNADKNWLVKKYGKSK